MIPTETRPRRALPARARRPEVSPLEERALLSTAGLPAADATAFVSRLYADLLNRPPDGVGLAGFSPLAESGPRGRLLAVRAILDSPEYRSVQIDRMYRDLLGRAPDDVGAADFDAFLRRPGVGIVQARAAVFGSAEYFEARGGGTAEGFVRALISDAFGRGVDAGTLDALLGRLEAGASRAEVAAQVLSSPEAHDALIDALYADLLGRAPDPIGRADFGAALRRGLGEERIVREIVLSPEYLGNAVGVTQDLVGLASGAGNLSTLVAAVQAAGLVEALQGPGPLTVFAPTDEAFAALPAGTLDALLADPDALRQVLLYHVVPGSFSSPRVVDAGTLTTLEGAPIGIRGGVDGPTINGAGLIATDLRATNGLVHVIDTVLLPPQADLVQTAIDAGSFSTLVAAVQAAGLVEALQGPGPLTVFAPTDEAFAALPAGTLDALLADPDALRQVLLYHVVPGSFSSAALIRAGLATTAQGAPVEAVRVGDRGLRINDAEAIVTNLVTTNGLIHAIDTVLLPPA